MTIIFLSMMMMSTLFLFLVHPLSMTIVLIMLTLMISMTTGIVLSTFILSYIILIIMTSGMLVLFVYMSSVASNEKFKVALVSGMLMIIIPITIMYMSNEISENTWMIQLSPKENMMFIKMFNYPMNILITFMVMYLFLTMIVVSNIVNFSQGPLRMKIYE
uniref:NADH dehydrogenase subunit 6 n=1 Tax=Urochela caudata TaxID=2880904 RepID=UPI001D0FACF4|nr:NADH dehydrogenase subunit 6 [Urochela caudata]UCC46127.1 NADH dehydrogenase subunit 6 [Urochela caudata]